MITQTPIVNAAAYDITDSGDIRRRTTGDHVCASDAREIELALNKWRDIAKRLAETGGGLGMYFALQYSAAIDEYKRMAAMPNVVREPSRTHDVKQPKT